MKRRIATVAVVLGVLWSAEAFAPYAGEMSPEVTYNPARNEFVVTYVTTPTLPIGTSTPVEMMARFFSSAGDQVGQVSLGDAIAESDGNINKASSNAVDRFNERMLVTWQQDDTVFASLIDLKNNSVLVKALVVGTTADDGLKVAVAFSQQQQRYLVAWLVAGVTVKGRYVNMDGTLPPSPTGDEFDIVTGGSSKDSLVIRHIPDSDKFMVVYNMMGNHYAKLWTDPTTAAADLGTLIAMFSNEIYVDFDDSSKKVVMIGNEAGILHRQLLTDTAVKSGTYDSMGITGAVNPSPIRGANDTGDQVIIGYMKDATVNAVNVTQVIGVQVNDDGTSTNLGVLGSAPQGEVEHFDVGYNYNCHRFMAAISDFHDMINMDLMTYVSGDPCLPRVEANPPSLNFGKVDPAVFATQTTGIKATMGPLNITSVSLAGVDAASFMFVENGCVGTLAENDMCVIAVAPAPGATGKRQAAIRVKTNASNAPTLDIPVTMDAAASALTVNLFTPFDRSSDIRPDSPLIWLAPKNAPESLGYRVTMCVDATLSSGCQVTTSYIRGK